jgi:hypothetical protein
MLICRLLLKKLMVLSELILLNFARNLPCNAFGTQKISKKRRREEGEGMSESGERGEFGRREVVKRRRNSCSCVMENQI